MIKNWDIYAGAIAIQRDGHVGILMGHENGKPVVDGEVVQADNMRLVPVEGKEDFIKRIAAELGHDEKGQAAIVEAVRLLRLKVANPLPASPVDEGGAKDDAAEYDVRTMDLVNKRVRLNDGRTGFVQSGNGVVLNFLSDDSNQAEVIGRDNVMSMISGENIAGKIVEKLLADESADEPALPVNYESLIKSLRAENTLLHREVDKLKAKPDFSEEFESLSKRLEQESSMREKAQQAAIEAEKLMEAAQMDAAQVRLEFNKLKNNPTPSPYPVDGEGKKKKPIEAKVVAYTIESAFEQLWADGWELMHTQFMDGIDFPNTVWRKINEYHRPDGSPIRNVVEVALPTIPDNSPMEETAGGLSLVEADAVLFGSVNNVDPLPASPVDEGGAKETEAVVLEPVVIGDADLFPRFDGILNGMPVAQAILVHGVEAVKEMGNMVAITQAVEAMSKGNALANRKITQFSSNRLEAAGV